jgi:hypothetical protein
VIQVGGDTERVQFLDKTASAGPDRRANLMILFQY